MDKPRAYEKVSQITLPDPSDQDPHPRLRVNGRGIHAGESFTALFPDGWHGSGLLVYLQCRILRHLPGRSFCPPVTSGTHIRGTNSCRKYSRGILYIV